MVLSCAYRNGGLFHGYLEHTLAVSAVGVPFFAVLGSIVRPGCSNGTLCFPRPPLLFGNFVCGGSSFPRASLGLPLELPVYARARSRRVSVYSDSQRYDRSGIAQHELRFVLV